MLCALSSSRYTQIMMSINVIVAVPMGGPQAPALSVAAEDSAVEVVACSDDGTFALAREVIGVGTTTTTTFLVIEHNGISERLPVSLPLGRSMTNGIDRCVCTTSAEGLASKAKVLGGSL